MIMIIDRGSKVILSFYDYKIKEWYKKYGEVVAATYLMIETGIGYIEARAQVQEVLGCEELE